jgi:hypothetical protein
LVAGIIYSPTLKSNEWHLCGKPSFPTWIVYNGTAFDEFVELAYSGVPRSVVTYSPEEYNSMVLAEEITVNDVNSFNAGGDRLRQLASLAVFGFAKRMVGLVPENLQISR